MRFPVLPVVFLSVTASSLAHRFSISDNLNVRATPSSAAARLQTLRKGTVVEVVCQTRGQPIASGLDVWDRLRGGGYVHDAYVRTGHRGFAPGIPRCDDDDSHGGHSNGEFPEGMNADGISLIKNAEGFYGNYYVDSEGYKTIGYGHACQFDPNKCRKLRPPLSKADAHRLLLSDLVPFVQCVRRHTKVALNSDQVSALASFAFNLGCGSLQRSTLLAKLNRGDYRGAAAEFGRWNRGSKSGVLRGLTKRRAEERRLFCRSGQC